MSQRWRGAGASALGLAVVVASCREPTTVEVQARTNVPFRPGIVVTFTVGAPGETEGTATTTEARDAWGEDGFVGSLAVIPRTGDEAPLAVRLVLGVDRDARSCTPPDYSGCIVARRRLHYSPHERLRLPITLYALCKDVPCDASSTCNALGLCVTAEVAPSTCGSAEGCSPADDPPPSGPVTPPDASIDAPAPSRDATPDAPTDAPPGDGGLDAGPDGGFGTPAAVECGVTSCNTAASNYCCLNTTTGTADCLTPQMGCINGNDYFTARCDGKEDCLPNQKCCAFAQNALCMIDCAPGLEVCHSTKTCTVGQCTGLFAGRYSTCQ